MTVASHILDFSPDRSAGRISVLPGAGSHWVPLAEARWSVLVPNGMPVRLFRADDATDEHLRPAAALPPDAIQHLILLDRPITDAGLVHLAPLTGLHLLDLFRTRVTDRGLAVISTFGRLRWLSLTGCRIGDAAVAHLAGLGALRRLSLKGTRVTDSVVTSLATMPRLEWLSLTDTAVSDAAVPGIAALPALRSVALDGTGVSPIGQAELTVRRPDLAVVRH
jgi:hypothetical protein